MSEANFRDEIAKLAVAQMMRDRRNFVDQKEMAEASYAIADAMIAARRGPRTSTTIADARMSIRATNALLALGCEFVEDAEKIPDHKIMQQRDTGETTLREIRDFRPL